MAARGPLKFLLQTPAGQYLVLGMGAVSFFPEQVQSTLGPIVKQYTGMTLNLGNGTSDGAKEAPAAAPAPIIIHTPSPTVISDGSSSRRSKLVGTIVYMAVGAGACWGIYVVGTQLLPDQFSRLLPVTRSVFESATQTLGTGLLNVKKALEERILGLSEQQEELSKKQDDTHKSVNHIKGELGEARIDLNLLRETLARCEGSLDDTQNMQGYTLRGVKLLVRCIAGFLPNDSNTVEELARYIEDGSADASAPAGPNAPNATFMASKTNGTTPSAQHRLPASSSSPSTGPSPMRADVDLSDVQALLGH